MTQSPIPTSPAPDEPPPQPPRGPELFDRHSTPTDHTLSPTHQIAFPGSNTIFAVEFTPDGRTAYCLVDGQSIDLWAAGLSHWPELLGGVLGLAIVVYLLVLARIKRRSQTPGAPYCRRCNYNVVSQAPDSFSTWTMMTVWTASEALRWLISARNALLSSSSDAG